MSQRDAAPWDHRIFAYGACASALALILLFPPALVDLVYLIFDREGAMHAVGEENFIWFVPIFSGRQIIISLWIVEIVACLILSIALLLATNKRQFRVGVAAIVFGVMVVASAAIPRERLRGILTEHDVSQSNPDLLQSLLRIWSDAPEEPEDQGRPVKQFFVFNTITLGLIAPAVLATWVLGIFVAAFAGFLIKSKRAVAGATSQSVQT